MGKYFDKFPLVSYSNNVVKNIIARVDFTTQTRNDINANFDYVLQDGVSRPDLLSHSYYSSPFYDWVIYLNNKMIDPYHDYYVSEDDMKKMIIAKYGSLEIAHQTIMYYRNNWAIDDGTIDTAIYEGLSGKLKKYYKPNIDERNQILDYSRLQEDWIRTTNKTIQLTLADGYVDNYNINDIISQSSSGASATIKSIDAVNNILTVQHVTGVFELSAVILAINTGPTEQYIDSDGTYKTKKLWQNIDDDEAGFWEAVSAFDYETEKNVLKRYINIIKSEYITDIDKILQSQMAG